MENSFEPGRLLRAVRRSTGLSQRELANSARVPAATIGQIEAGRRMPGVALFARIAAAGGFRLELTAHDAGPDRPALRLDDEHDVVRDRGGRRFPAHLRWAGKPDYWTDEPPWWGWHHIAWYFAHDPAVPDHVFYLRPRPLPSSLGRDPWEHPFWS